MFEQTAAALYGRDQLLAVLSEWARPAGPVTGQSALLLGDRGSGKTALLAAAGHGARTAGLTVVRIGGERGDPPFATLRRLLSGFPGLAGRLSAAHQAAVSAAADGDGNIGATATAAPGLVLATAVLSFVRAASASGPVLIIVDDADQLDPGSAGLLAFAARRLAGSGTRLLLASLPETGAFTDQATDIVLRAEPLPASAADELLRGRFPIIPAGTRRRIIEDAAGNPRDLVEQGYAAVAGSSWSPTADDVAARLTEQAAIHTRARGDAEGAATAWRRSAELSPDPADRARRFAAAACSIADVTGDLAAVERLLDEARRAGRAAPGHAGSLEAVIAACHVALNRGEPAEALHQRLIQSLSDSTMTAESWALEEAVWLLYVLGWYVNRRDRWTAFSAVVARHQVRLPPWAVLAGALTGPGADRAAHASEADRVADALAEERVPWTIVRAALITRDRDHRFGWRQALQRVWASQAGGPAVVSAIYAAQILGDDATGSGDWDTARRLNEEALRMTRALGHRVVSEPWLLYTSARIAAHRGDLGTVQRRTGRLLAWAEPRGARELQWRAQHVRAIAALGAGDPASAYRYLSAIGDPGGYGAPIAYNFRVALDFAEAAAGAGDEAAGEAAREAVRNQVASMDPGAGDRRSLLYAGALAIASAGDIDRNYRRALGIRDADQWPFDLARIQLSYGERLRAAGAAEPARAQLRLAAATFRRLSTLPWLARATGQLRALGDGPERTPNGTGLTSTERRIAELAARGLTNRAIAAELRIAASTVGAQLSRVYAKLGIGGRAALRDALADEGAGGEGRAELLRQSPGPLAMLGA
jgi:DNA-binding CsgD family transcriptional regulator